MLILWIVLGTLAALALVLFAGRSMVAREHSATSTIVLKAPPEKVFEAITDWRNHTTWRKEVTSVEELPGGGGWVETSRFGRLPLRIEKSEPPRLFVGRIADDSLPYGGTWTHRLERTAEGGTRLATTEDGFIGPAPFRLITKLFFGYHRTLNAYQRALAAKFGETAAPHDG